MKYLTVLFTLSLIASISAKPGVPKNEGKMPSEVVMKTPPNMSMEGNQKSMTDENSKDVDFRKTVAECNKTFIIQPSFLHGLEELGGFPDETDINSKCHIRCVLEKTGIASEEGTFDSARAALLATGERRGARSRDVVEAMFTTCGHNRVEPCKCERSYQYMKCTMNTMNNALKNHQANNDRREDHNLIPTNGDN